MVRITRGQNSLRKHKKFLKLAKGYVGSNSNLSTMAMEQLVQSFNFAYVGRKLKKRNFRRIWIHKINSIIRLKNITYSKFIGDLRNIKILLNRKILSLLAIKDKSSFNIISSLNN